MSEFVVTRASPRVAAPPEGRVSSHRQTPALTTVIELFKPITWFAPMWAFMCGVVSSGASFAEAWPLALLGILLAGPLLCATSQAANDWYDRHVDAINEPHRPIPSGRMPGRWGLWIALIWSGLSLALGAALGIWVFVATAIGLALAWAYSAPPFRLKRNGWWGNAAVGACYEGLPWFTGAAAVSASIPDERIVAVAILYSIGAHGIMTLNDFKSIDGDTACGVKSLPVQLGVDNAARLACWVMALPQVVVIALLIDWGLGWHGLAVAALLGAQVVCMYRMVGRPVDLAPWYNATGTSFYVVGMLATALALRSIVGAGG
ncbi:MAG: chlorophyll synthase ChlG [Rhizobiales bacterium]|nr:chlorophyll synthase ChlG [Hyphomicrobiales bacterium]